MNLNPCRKRNDPNWQNPSEDVPDFDPDTPILKRTPNDRPQSFDLQGIIFLKSFLTI